MNCYNSSQKLILFHYISLDIDNDSRIIKIPINKIKNVQGIFWKDAIINLHVFLLLKYIIQAFSSKQ